MADEVKTPNSFDIILEKLQQQEQRIVALEKENTTLKKEVTDVTELNRALLNKEGAKTQNKDTKPVVSDKFKQYLDED